MIKRALLSMILISGLMSAPALAAVEAIPGMPLQTAGPAPTPAATTLNVDVDHGVPLILTGPASSVFIANPEIADVQVMSPTSIMVFGKRTGETSFMAVDASGNTLAQRTVIVTQDLSNLRRELAIAIPGNRIRVEPLPNGLVLTGDARDPASVADAYKLSMRYIAAGGDIINRVRVVGSNQIQLRVRFAEVQRNIDNTLGFDWQSLATVAGFTFGIATGISGLATGANILTNRPNNTDLSLPNDAIGVTR
ncbi:MAG: pilus assembly protein N-terminal domain-containing protein, partial [Pseudomonadota bacterium]|nr:pilus assembly protein N-terminal domain-containing protein [Pseudomonadota bacterium]